jgi:hypothetical protein
VVLLLPGAWRHWARVVGWRFGFQCLMRWCGVHAVKNRRRVGIHHHRRKSARRPSTVASACVQVGTGVSDVDRQKLREKLQPVLVGAGPGIKAPFCYRLVWVWVCVCGGGSLSQAAAASVHGPCSGVGLASH